MTALEAVVAGDDVTAKRDSAALLQRARAFTQFVQDLTALMDLVARLGAGPMLKVARLAARWL
jgi:hypothetical protein